jgi:ferredoxin--NADP+ reductase
VFRDLEIPPLDPDSDRFMICGNMRMLTDADQMLDSRGLTMSPQIGVPGDYVIERAFVESSDAVAKLDKHAGSAAQVRVCP